MPNKENPAPELKKVSSGGFAIPVIVNYPSGLEIFSVNSQI